MSELYFYHKDFEYAEPLWQIKDKMRINSVSEHTVYLAEKSKDRDAFYCTHYGEVGLKSEGGCGKICEGYQPRNGKRGMCKHQRPTYEPSDETLIVRVKLD